MSKRIFTATPKNYGGAYDVDPEMFFTREDLNELGDAVIEKIPSTFGENFKLEEAYIGGTDNQEVTVRVENLDSLESFEGTAHIDMRKIKRPSDLVAKYADDIVSQIMSGMMEYDNLANQDNTIESSTSITDWDSMDVYEQTEVIKKFVKSYRGKKVFEDFADRVGVPADDVIDLFCDAEAHGFIKIPKRMQAESEYANDDIYSSEVVQAGLFGNRKKNKQNDAKSRMDEYLNRVNQVGGQLDNLQKDALNKYGKVVQSAECSTSDCYQNVATGRTYSSDQMHDMYNYHQSRNGYTGSYEEWVEEKVNDGTLITCSNYMAPGPGDYDPPEDEFEYDDVEEVCELDMDNVVIIISDDGNSWDYEDKSYEWAKASEDSEDLYSDEYPNVLLSDHTGTVENVDSLLESLLPAEPGKYSVSGHVKLVYDIEGIAYKTVPDYEGGSATEEYSDDADASFNFRKSSITDFKYRKIR